MDSDCLACSSSYLQGNIKKRLVVCCDGTFSGLDKGTDQYSSNVARLSRVISRVGIDTKGEKVPQIVYYQSGVGTGSLTTVNKSLQGFICQVGLLPPLMLDHFYEIFQAYKNRGKLRFEETDFAKGALLAGELGTMPLRHGEAKRDLGTRIDYLRKTAHHHIKIKVVGVWDTVGSLGATNWFGQAGEDTYFHSTKLSPKIENAFHALAIDETRGNFPPTLWYLDSSCLDKEGKPKVNLKQCWFPGYHADIGGQREKGDSDINSVDEIAFAWMCDQLFGHLQLSGTALQKYILFRIGGGSDLDTKNKKIRDLNATWSKIAWSDGILDDTNGWTDLWWIPSLLSTRAASYKRVPGETPATEVVDGKKKDIPYQWFNEEIHPSVFHRKENCKGYIPAPFKKGSGWDYVKAAPGKRAHWVKKKSNGTEVVLHEYVIPQNEKYQAGAGYDFWQGSLERTFTPKEVLAAQDVNV